MCDVGEEISMFIVETNQSENNIYHRFRLFSLNGLHILHIHYLGNPFIVVALLIMGYGTINPGILRSKFWKPSARELQIFLSSQSQMLLGTSPHG